MNVPEVLRLYDEQLRRDPPGEPGQRIDRSDGITRLVGQTPHENDNYIIYTHLDPSRVDDVIDEQTAFFDRLGHNFEWKIYDHDRPAGLVQRLTARGYEAQQVEALLAIEPASVAPVRAPDGVEIRSVSGPDGIDELIRLEEAVWNRDLEWARRLFMKAAEEQPGRYELFGAYADGRMVTAAWLRLHPQREFADLCGGTTLPEYRRRGIYRAMVAHRARLAAEWGVRFLTVEAWPASRPILEKSGFGLLTQTTACVWRRTGRPQVDQ